MQQISMKKILLVVMVMGFSALFFIPESYGWPGNSPVCADYVGGQPAADYESPSTRPAVKEPASKPVVTPEAAKKPPVTNPVATKPVAAATSAVLVTRRAVPVQSGHYEQRCVPVYNRRQTRIKRWESRMVWVPGSQGQRAVVKSEAQSGTRGIPAVKKSDGSIDLDASWSAWWNKNKGEKKYARFVEDYDPGTKGSKGESKEWGWLHTQFLSDIGGKMSEVKGDNFSFARADDGKYELKTEEGYLWGGTG